MGLLFGFGVAATFMCGVGFIFTRILRHAGFKAHQEIAYLYCDGESYSCGDERCTKMTFKDWKSLYLADPEHWRCVKGRSENDEFPVAIPVYVNGNTMRPVKFLNERSYNKWQRYLMAQANKGIDYRNSQNKMELLQQIATANQQRIIEEQEKLNKLQEQLSVGDI